MSRKRAGSVFEHKRRPVANLGSARTTDHELMWVSLASEFAWRTYTKALCVPSTPGDANSGSTNLVESGTYTKYMCEDE